MLGESGMRGGRGLQGWRAEDDDIDSVLDPAFASPGNPPHRRGWNKMAAGRTSRPRSGLCVVINGNLKQRELTISFFISSPMLCAQERPRRTRSPSRVLRTHTHTETPCKHTYTRVHPGGKGRRALLAPRGVDLFEGDKREEKA